MNRADHLAWVKLRAMAYVEAGNMREAFQSLLNDMGKHPETKKHPDLIRGTHLFLNRELDSKRDMTNFIQRLK